MALRAVVSPSSAAPAALHLFRRILREVPRVLVLYDLDMSITDARRRVRDAFKQNAWVNDERAIRVLCHKAETELEEATLQYKTKAQLMTFLEPRDHTLKQEKAMRDENYAFYAGYKPFV
ncbi:hypothetical protein CTAYLR_008107 [Chrysophaeum taylorii]|uniref:Complex 1 LYR protein domain-containing protein n=1 Tax=Chrysophaeum taylorii TaxID=2483200 RepID=A0AAD7UC98_9STRA|nr:hypothetical protein CTAYLR_008107 [Chrysophaeum taylorii]